MVVVLLGEDSGDVFFVSGEDRAWKLQVVDVVEVQGWSVSGWSFARCCCVVERRDGDLLSFRGCCLGYEAFLEVGLVGEWWT